MRGTKYEKGIRCNWKKIDTWREGKVDIQFDMSSVAIKTEHGKEICFENEEFEKIMAEYIRRKKVLKKLNKKN